MRKKDGFSIVRTAKDIPFYCEELNCQPVLEYQALLDNSSLGIAFTRNRIFLHCNERWSEMFGWTCDELAGQPTIVVYPSQQAFDDLSHIAIPILSSAGRLDTELVLKRRDGSTFWCRLLAKAVDPADQAKGTIFIVEDITERKAAEESLKQLLLEYQAILDNALIGITFTRNRTFLHCNARFTEMFGWSGSELIGLPTSILYPSQDAFEELGRIAIPTLGSGLQLDTELLMRRRDGSLFWCRMLAKAIDPTDSSKGTIFLTEDITERRAARDELERRVQERTAELAAANEQLQAEIVERRAAEEKIRHLANHDALTGLPNRRLLEDRMEQSMALARREGEMVAIQFVDLDRFKSINDTHGHKTGDMLLQAVASRLRHSLREADTVARVGGDEFVIVLANLASVEAACEIAEKLLNTLAQSYDIGHCKLSVTPSIGISVFPRDSDDVGTLLQYADAAMYRAKQRGRENYQLFSHDMLQSGQ